MVCATSLQPKLTSMPAGGVVSEIISRKTPRLSLFFSRAPWPRGRALCCDTLVMTWPPLVTAGPGLVGALVVGVCGVWAKGSAWATDLPLIPFITWKATCWPTCLATPDLSRHLWPAWSRVAHYAGTRACLGRHGPGSTIDDVVGEAWQRLLRRWAHIQVAL